MLVFYQGDLNMILNKEQISRLTIGALSVSERDGWFSFRRFTEKQMEHYRVKRNGELYKKALASAGVRLDMMTDAERLSFDFRVEKTCGRPFYSLDLYVDGIFFETLCVRHIFQKNSGSLSFALPAGKHRITLYLPNLMITSLTNIELTNATFAEPFETKKKILFFGDSITQGYNAYRASLSYTNRFSRDLDADLCNQAIGSEIFDANVIDPDLPFSPDLIVTAYGTNDWAVQKTEAEFLGAAEAFFARLRDVYPDRLRVYISPIWRGHTQGIALPAGTFDAACENLKKLAEKYDFFVVDGSKMVLHNEEFYEDKDVILHPNDLGFAIYAENLLAALKPIL